MSTPILKSLQAGWLEKREVRFVLLGASFIALMAAVYVAGLGNWSRLADTIKLNQATLALGLAILAVCLFGLSRAGAGLWPALTWITIVCVYAILSWFLVSGFFAVGTPKARAIAFGFMSVAFLFAVAVMLLTSETARTSTIAAVRSALDWRTSAGPTVLLLWSAVVVYAVSFIAAQVFIDGNDATLTCEGQVRRDCIVQDAWSDYLILLGLPGAAAAFAQKGESQPGNGPAPDQATNVISDIQYFVLNVLAMLVVVGGLWRRGVLGEIPDVLLAVTGASALTFALVKRLPDK